MFSAFGQNTGHLGKQVMIKAKIVNGVRMPFNSLEVESTLTRMLAVTASVNRISFERKEFVKEDKWSLILDRTTIRPGPTTGYFGTAGLKIYFDRIVPAPTGFYTSFDLGFGAAFYDFEFKAEKGEMDNFGIEEITVTSGKKKKGSYFFYSSLPTIGYQTVFFKLFTVDVKMALEILRRVHGRGISF